MVTEVIRVEYKGQEVGAVSYDAETKVGHFEYEPKFRRTGIELSPIHMPLSDHIYTFPGLDRETFKGLPGLLADSLPDDFGHAVLNAWPDKLSPRKHIGTRPAQAAQSKTPPAPLPKRVYRRRKPFQSTVPASAPPTISAIAAPVVGPSWPRPLATSSRVDSSGVR